MSSPCDPYTRTKGRNEQLSCPGRRQNFFRRGRAAGTNCAERERELEAFVPTRISRSQVVALVMRVEVPLASESVGTYCSPGIISCDRKFDAPTSSTGDHPRSGLVTSGDTIFPNSFTNCCI